METLHLTNSHFKSDSPINRLILLLVALITLFLVVIYSGLETSNAFRHFDGNHRRFRRPDD